MEALQAAAVARAEAVWVASSVHEPNAVGTLPPTPYLVVSVDAGREEGRMLCGDASSDAHRLVAMAVGKDMTELTFAVDKAKAAFRGHRFTVTGYDVTPNVGESSGPVTRDPDAGGQLSLTLVYTFNATPISQGAPA